jgi:hypothetical protein
MFDEMIEPHMSRSAEEKACARVIRAATEERAVAFAGSLYEAR